jgi:hypothetical protein
VNGGLRRAEGGHAGTRPLDLVLDDAALQSVASDAKDIGGFHDAARSYECFLTELALCVGEVERVEDDRHAATIVVSRSAVKKKMGCRAQFVHVLGISVSRISINCHSTVSFIR